MAFNPDDKIQWENFSPTLQALLDKKIKAGGQDYFNNNINKYVDQAVNTSKNYTNTQINSPTFMQKILVNVMSTEPTGEFKKYMDNAIFTNLPPKVGYLDDTKMQIYSAFNMSYGTSHGMCLSDSEGRTNVWFPGSANIDDTSKLYRAYRVFDSAQFSVDNDPIVPEYMIVRNSDGSVQSVKGYVKQLIQANGKYFIAQVIYGGALRIHYIKTNYSGNTKNWVTFKDITSIYNRLSSELGNLFGCIYHPSSGNIFGAGLKATTESGRTGGVIRLACVRSNGSVLYNYQVQDVSYVADTNNSNRTYRNITNYIPAATYYGGTGGVILNKHNELFVFWDTNGQCIKGGATAHWRRSAQILAFKVNENSLFTNASYRVSNAIPQSYYNSNNLFFLPNSYCNGEGMVKYAYDTLMDRVIPMKTWQDCKNGPFYYLNRTDKALSAGWGAFQTVYAEDFQPPDACLWAKQMYEPHVVGNNVYIRGKSWMGKGLRTINCEITKDTQHDRRFGVVAGSWIDADKTGYDLAPNSQQMCCTKVGNNGNWYAFKWNALKVEVYTLAFKSRTGDNGKTYTDVPKFGSLVGTVDLGTYTDIASKLYIPTGNIAAYHPTSNTLYVYLLRRGYRPSSIYSTESQRGVWIAAINMATKAISMGKVNGLTEIYNYGDGLMKIHPEYGTFSNPVIESNFFMPQDGAILMTMACRRDDGGKYQGDWLFTKSGSNWTATKIPQLSQTWQYGKFGYDTKFGYFACSQSSLYANARIYSSKDIYGTGAEKTYDQMFKSGQKYYIDIISSGSIGLSCTTSPTPVFLGGYYSLVPAKEIALYDNATNYVYLHRDPLNRLEVIWEVYTEPLGKVPIAAGKPYSDSSQFGRVLIAQIKTQNGYAVSQTVFPIGDGYLS